MLTSEQMKDLLDERRVLLARKKTAVYAEFLLEYGEYAEWEDWLTFLKDRAELEGFEWVKFQ